MIRKPNPNQKSPGGNFGNNLKSKILNLKLKMDQAEEIKSRLDIVEIIREYIPLKPAGINFRALCPFHREKSPSFIVSSEKQIWHCFGCGRGGDVFSFLMEIEGLGFAEVLRNLAPRAGVTLKRQDPKLTSQRNRLLDIMEAAVNYYHKSLDREEAKSVREYLANRGLKEETIQSWQIGYSPESWDDLINLLKGKGYTENEIFLAGLSTKKENSARFYNRFRGRIMFPIFDASGAAVAFSARVRPDKEREEKMGKYINSPATMIYDKSRILFGLDKAKMAIKNEDLAIIVEGQMDVITAHQNNFKNVVASSGTALVGEQDRTKPLVELQKRQVDLLKRYTNNIALAFDMDKAGQMASDRGIREAMAAEMNIKIIIIPSGKDPDECIRNNPGEWARAAAEAKPIMEYYFDKIFSGLNLEEVGDKRRAVKEILPILAKLGNKIEQDFWLKKLAEKIEVEENILRETLINSVKKEPRRPAAVTPENKPEGQKFRPGREEMLSELMLALSIRFPGLLAYIVDRIQPDQIVGSAHKSFYKDLIIYYNNTIGSENETGEARVFSKINYDDLKKWFAENSAPLSLAEDAGDVRIKLLDRLVLLGDKDFYDLDEEKARGETIKIVMALKKCYLTRRMKEIERTIAHCEEEGEGGKARELMEELKMLSDEIREVGE
ncbi:MAG: DNA primase [Patescibacteria group bacterium]|nr:DNA primase [Patescibacteria group bacterium]MDD5554365.1 DNA primase [Patescibacteria group bacterium]